MITGAILHRPRFFLPACCPGVRRRIATSNKWRIELTGQALTTGEILFRVTPRQGESIDVSIGIKSGRDENNVAKDVRDAFAAKLSPRALHRRSRRRRGHPDQEEGRPTGLCPRAVESNVQTSASRSRANSADPDRQCAPEYAGARRQESTNEPRASARRRPVRGGVLHLQPRDRRWRAYEYCAQPARGIER